MGNFGVKLNMLKESGGQMTENLQIAIIAALATVLGAVLAIIGGVVQSIISNRSEKRMRITENKRDIYLRMVDLVLNFKEEVDEFNKTQKVPGTKNLEELLNFQETYQSKILVEVNTKASKEFEQFISQAIDITHESETPFQVRYDELVKTGEKVLTLVRKDLGFR